MFTSTVKGALVLLSMGLVYVMADCAAESAYNVPYIFHADPPETPEAKAEVERGFAWAKAHIPTLADSTLEWDGDPTDMVTYGHIRLTKGTGGQARGCWISVGTDGYLAQVVAHELGHCAGMHHVDVPGALLYPTVPDDLVWTPADQAECERSCR